ncbi:MAG: chromate transporter [Eubacteriales bacterium]|nr:chromate transporter [Eubacteriales bacterium]
MSYQKKEGSLPDNCSMYWQLFKITFFLSACTFGGGFVIISMMKKKFVEELHWLTEEEMLDMTAIAQSSPGALGVNIAIVVGYRLKKVKGAIVCTLAAVLPPLFIISIISVFYNQWKNNAYIAVALQVMRAGVAAVICDVVFSLAQNVIMTKQILWISLMILSFIATVFFHVSAVIIILICGAAGFLNSRSKNNKEKRI